MNSVFQHSSARSQPALLSYGFRPFFLLGAAWAILAMGIWIGMLGGVIDLPSAFDPIAWHAHEFLFGYLYAIIAGFLLTALPNWTARPPLIGWPLAILCLLWLFGRISIAFSEHLGPAAAAAIDLTMPCCLCLVVVREIWMGRNWRNLVVVALLSVLIVSNALFHWEVAAGDYPAQGYGLRIGLATSIVLIGVIGGRIVPAFTRNWLVKQKIGRRPAEPMRRFDLFTMLFLLVAMIFWIATPFGTITGTMLLLSGLLHLIRLARWSGYRAVSEPLVWVLHVGYFFIPLGALAMGFAILNPSLMSVAQAQHLWSAGAIGMMTLAVMTRASLGHTGQTLQADWGITWVYGLLLVSVAARIAADFLPGIASGLFNIAGLCWMGAFAGFVVRFGPLLGSPVKEN